MNDSSQQLYEQATTHKINHNCSAIPYEDYEKLAQIVAVAKPVRILEIGTGIGFTSIVMAKVLPNSHINTIEKDQTHAKLAREFIAKQNLNEQIHVINDIAEIVLPDLVAQGQIYDLIFFDGFQIHYEFLPHYEQLLQSGGVLVLGNNHLDSKTSQQFFDQLELSPKLGGKWQILDKFNDTTVAKRL